MSRGCGLSSITRRELVSGTKMLGMWRDDSAADPLNTVTNDIKNRKSIALEVMYNTIGIYCINCAVVLGLF